MKPQLCFYLKNFSSFAKVYVDLINLDNNLDDILLNIS